MRSFRLPLVAAIAAVCLAAPLVANAASVRHATPTGSGPSPCLAVAPCSPKSR